MWLALFLADEGNPERGGRRMEKLPLLLTAILLLAALSLSAGMPIPPEVKAIVTFIFVPNEEGTLVPNGTGFFVGVRNPEKQDSFLVYIVTAKHVIQKPDRSTYFSTVFVRVNKKEGEAEILRLNLVPEGPLKNVFVHQDATVDVAVIPALVDPNKYDFKFLPDDYLTTKEDFAKLKIREGSDVFFTGLFLLYLGAHRNYPIVRFGRVALVTSEKVSWDAIPTELYLVESGPYGGSSGSPVFFYLGADREPGGLIVGDIVLKLAGIMKGSFGEGRAITFAETARVPMVVSNMGIAAVVPAYKLHEILFGNELKSWRKR